MYVDGFLLPLPKKNIAAYRKMATAASKIWAEYGCKQYFECLGDDLHSPGVALSFTKPVRAKPGETVVFSWIVYKSKAQRDQVNKKIMKDPRIQAMSKGPMPFDGKRMHYGGFRVLVKR